MKSLFLIAGLLGFATIANAEVKKGEKLLVCITFYDPLECNIGMVTSTGRCPKHLKTVAVDPKFIKYNTRLKLPGFGTVVAEDTGSWVKKRVASRKRAAKLLKEHKITLEEYPKYRDALVIDVFVKDRTRLNYFMKNYPQYVTATVL